MIEKEVSLVKGEDRVQFRIESETYQTPPAFGLPASGRARIEETLAGVLKLYRADHWKAL